MTAVTTDGARTGAERSDYSGCSFPCSLVTATPFHSAIETPLTRRSTRHDNTSTGLGGEHIVAGGAESGRTRVAPE